MLVIRKVCKVQTVVTSGLDVRGADLPESGRSARHRGNTEVVVPMWDEEVDVLCVGGVIGALASAVVAADAGVDVMVATTPAHDGSWPAAGVADPETAEYFAALAGGSPVVASPADVGVTVCAVEAPPEGRGRTVAPFYGARLATWTAECLASPYGLMHTRVTDWGTDTVRTVSDGPVQVKIVGTMATAGAGSDASSLVGWLFDTAHARRIHLGTEATLQRLVFEEGVVVGAVLDTADGEYAVAARHGVTLAPAVAVPANPVAHGDQEMQVALISKAGSRFARVELLASAPPAATRNAPCPSTNRQLPTTLREKRRGRSETRRWRKVDGYPPFGQ
jgi:hypothetical protein